MRAIRPALPAPAFAASLVVLALASGLSVAAAAEDPGRYSMTPTDKGFLRLDQKTGVVSLCAKKGETFACESVADDAAKLQAENQELTRQNEALKAENKRLEDVLGLGDDKSKRAEGRGDDKGFKVPSEQEIDKAMDEVARLAKKFKEKLKELGGDEKGEKL